MFSISIIDTSRPVGCGEIRIGAFREAFEVVFEHWSPEDYEHQWMSALRRLLEQGKSTALITSLTDPGSASFLFWWPAYRDGSEVVFQNGVLFLDELAEPFEPSRCDDFVPPRQRTTEDGEPISEWRAPVADIRTFLSGFAT